MIVHIQWVNLYFVQQLIFSPHIFELNCQWSLATKFLSKVFSCFNLELEWDEKLTCRVTSSIKNNIN